MAALIELPTFKDKRGSLTVVEKILPFEIKRVYFIYNVMGSERGGHRHKITKQALICLKGNCTIFCDNGFMKKEYILDSPTKCLLLNPEDYHIMKNFTKDAVLLVLASEYFNERDYIDEPYNRI